ncbi:MAG TPA: DUF58 domain-containing protein [Thermoanaerobaculia bacterium]|jgi:uncharacterized protein (DUF58 family)|nr:DUF58 domain-containing protein [Thermoanaerobaculia bacterium]
MRPTRRAVLVAVAGLAVAVLPAALDARLWPFWPVYLGLLALALGADSLLLPNRRQVACSVELPGTLYIGEEEEAALTVRVPSSRPVPVAVAVDLSERLEPQPQLRGRASAAGSELRFRLVPTRRGRIIVERAWVRYAGPLGLMAAVARVELKKQAPVVPNIRPVKRAALRFLTDREFRAGLKIERYRGEGTEFDSLKEHVPGDDHRWMDWKASARHRKLVARQFRAERNHQVVIAIDTGHLMCEPLAGIPKVDHAVNTALLLAYISLRAGDRVGLATFDSRPGLYVEPKGGQRAFHAITHMASQVDYTDRETNYTLGLTSIAQKLSRRSLIVVLTDFVDTISAELMVENLDRLSRRHLVVFVALQDPGLAATAAGAPASLLDLNRAVVAGGLLRDREVVLRRLRRLGIYPIDAAPAQVTPRLINTYLDIKRREKI